MGNLTHTAASTSRGPSPRFAAAWLAIGVLVAPLGGAQEPVADVRALRTQLRRDLLTALLPELKTHRDELLALERKCAAAQDFAGAVRARDDRLTVEGEIGAMEKELPIVTTRAAGAAYGRASERIELKLADASLTDLRLDPADQALAGFGTASGTATWTLPSLPPGGYEVLLRTSGGEGSVMLSESFYTLAAPLAGPNEKSGEKNVGTLRIRDGKGQIALRAAAPEKCAGLRVYSLALVPASR